MSSSKKLILKNMKTEFVCSISTDESECEESGRFYQFVGRTNLSSIVVLYGSNYFVFEWSHTVTMQAFHVYLRAIILVHLEVTNIIVCCPLRNVCKHWWRKTWQPANQVVPYRPYRLDSKNILKCRVCFGKRNKKYGVGTHEEGGYVDTFASFEGKRKVAQLKSDENWGDYESEKKWSPLRTSTKVVTQRSVNIVRSTRKIVLYLIH